MLVVFFVYHLTLLSFGDPVFPFFYLTEFVHRCFPDELFVLHGFCWSKFDYRVLLLAIFSVPFLLFADFIFANSRRWLLCVVEWRHLLLSFGRFHLLRFSLVALCLAHAYHLAPT